MNDILGNLIFPTNNVVRWSPYKGETIVGNFAESQWGKIFSDINSDEELKKFESEKYGNGYVVYECKNNESIGFVYLLVESVQNKRVFVHGGSWSDNARLKYASLLTVASALFNINVKIHTTCMIDNERAFRFLHSIGFVKYYSTKKYHYMWLPYKRFVNTFLFQKMKNVLNLYGIGNGTPSTML